MRLRYNIKIRGPLVVMASLLFLTTGCMQTGQGTAPATTSPEPKDMVFDADSWKEIIPETCTAYFDGCNNCRRLPGAELAACTRKACMAYAMPKCLESVEPDNQASTDDDLP